MSVIIATVTHREFEQISARGWSPWVMSPAEFRRFFRQDPGYVRPGLKIAVIGVNYSILDIVNALGNGNDDTPELRIAGRISDDDDPADHGRGA